jgi:hypothetical protein
MMHQLLLAVLALCVSMVVDKTAALDQAGAQSVPGTGREPWISYWYLVADDKDIDEMLRDVCTLYFVEEMSRVWLSVPHPCQCS